ICKVREASKEGPYADELDNRGEKLPERQQHERCRVLHLRSERSGSVASIEATSIHLQPPCTFTRRMVRARSKRPNPIRTMVHSTCRAMPPSASRPDRLPK